MFRWPTSLLPICPSGRPTDGPDVWTSVFGKSRSSMIVGRLARERDRVAFDGRGVSPAIENRENQRLRRGHYCRNAFLAGNFAAPQFFFDAQQAGCTWRCGRCGWPSPVLIWPALVATARSAMNGLRSRRSGARPPRCSRIGARRMASSVSVSVPIWLTFTRIELRRPSRCPLQALGVGDEQIVADELDLGAERVGQQLPAVPIVFGHAVFDGDDRILPDPVGPELHHLLGGALALVGLLEHVLFAVLS
jgi:hypothetical protein